MESRQKFSTIKEQVLRTAEEHRLWSPHDTLVVAVSGGPDSVALLHVLKDISETAVPLNLICAHAHHGLRPEADEEAELVRRLAAELGIRFEMARVDVPSYMKESGKGVEEAARFKRYEFLFETAQACGANTIALAHHADDQAETVLMHLLRGSGPGGSGESGSKDGKKMWNLSALSYVYTKQTSWICVSRMVILTLSTRPTSRPSTDGMQSVWMSCLI